MVTMLQTCMKDGSTCVCMCVLEQAGACMCVSFCMWRSEVDIGCLPQLIPTLDF